MQNSGITSVMVAGSGVLGGQIAFQSAFKGKQVRVYDISDDALNACRQAHHTYEAIYITEYGATETELSQTRARILYTTDMAEAVTGADLIIEAIPEVPDIKNAFYAQLAQHVTPRTLIATNSSTLLPGDFAHLLPHPEQFCALHFANYIWAFNFAEVMAHKGTSDTTLASVFRFAIDIGMVPVPVEKEVNAYILNGWAVPLAMAAVTLVVNGVGSPESVDKSYMIFNKGCRMGPLGMIDIVGMTTIINIFRHWGQVNGDTQMLKNADFLQTHYADKGKNGVLSCEGFYQYPNPAFDAKDFIAVPDYSVVDELVARTRPSSSRA